MIEIYGKLQCPYCDKAKALCERENYEYSYKQLDEDFTREDFFESVTKVIIFDNQSPITKIVKNILPKTF